MARTNDAPRDGRSDTDDGSRDGGSRWWRYLIYGTLAVAVAVAYVFYFDAHRAGASAPTTPASLDEMSRDPAARAAGKDIFDASCAPCHAANAGGRIGPNLTDAYWLHGGRPDEILRSVRDGWVDKGMPARACRPGDHRSARRRYVRSLPTWSA